MIKVKATSRLYVKVVLGRDRDGGRRRRKRRREVRLVIIKGRYEVYRRRKG